MASAEIRAARKRVPFPAVINTVPYRNIGELHNSGGKTNLRTGLKVTVSIPPTLRAFRYPNLVSASTSASGGGTPVISNDNRKKVHERQQWYLAARKGKSTSAQRRLQKKFSTTFDITDFLTSLSWSSARENGFVEVNISLDNAQGLFNYLPNAAKVTIWRRKQLKNVRGTSQNALNAGKWYPYIVCYIMDKSRTADGRDHGMELVCQDRAGFLLANDVKKKKVYKKDKRHPNGWSPREVTLDMCRENGIPVNPRDLPKSYRGKPFPRLPKFEPAEKSVGDYISDVWKASSQRFKRSDELLYVIHMRTGTLKVELVSPPGTENSQDQIIMFNDEDNIETATLKESLTDDNYTQLVATGTYKVRDGNNTKGKPKYKKVKIKKKVFNASDPLVQEAYGVKIKNKNYKKRVFKNEQDFNQTAQRAIDDLARPKYTLELKGKAALGLWPARYVNLTSRFLGVRGNFIVENVTYTVTEGLLEVDLTLKLDQKHFKDGNRFFTKHPRISGNLKWY